MKQYGYTETGETIQPPTGWKLLPEGEWVPHVHREATENGTWCAPRSSRSTMTPLYARVAGYVRAIAVPQDYEWVPQGATHVLRDAVEGDFGGSIERVTYYQEFEALGMRLLKHWTGYDWAVATTLPWSKLAPL